MSDSKILTKEVLFLRARAGELTALINAWGQKGMPAGLIYSLLLGASFPIGESLAMTDTENFEIAFGGKNQAVALMSQYKTWRNDESTKPLLEKFEEIRKSQVSDVESK